MTSSAPWRTNSTHPKTVSNLQIEARAHIRVQRAIDRRHAAGALPEPASAAFIRELHREFYADAPEAMLLIGEGSRQLRMVPGEFRLESWS